MECNCFEILNIPLDSDIKDIKKSYAKLVKLHNPEDDPEGYQKIRKAYDEALKTVKIKKKESNIIETKNNDISADGIKEKTIDKEYERKEEDININDKNIFDLYDNEEKNKKKTNMRDIKSIYDKGNYISKDSLIKSKVEIFIAELSIIYGNLEDRLNKERWRQAFQNQVLWDIEANELLNKSIIQFLLTHKYFPHDVYVLFDKYFEITKNEIKFTKYFSISTLEEVIERINREDILNYDFLKEIPIESLDEYLNLRELAYEHLEHQDLEKAENFIKYAYKIYNKDPELIKLKGMLCYLNLNYRESKKYMRKVLEIKPNDEEALGIFKKSNIFCYINKKIDKFMDDYIKYIRIIFNTVKTLFYIFIALSALGFVLSNLVDKDDSYNASNYKNEAVYDSYKSTYDKKLAEEKMKKIMFESKLILAVHNKETCSFNLKDIKSTDYYILKDGNCIKITQEDENYGLKDTVESRVYLGKINKKIIVFSDDSNHYSGDAIYINSVGKEVSSTIFAQIMNDNLEYAQAEEKWFENYIFIKSNRIGENKFTDN